MARGVFVEQLAVGENFVLADDRRLFVRTVMATRRYNEQGNQYVLLEWRKAGCDAPRGAMTAVVGMHAEVVDMVAEDEILMMLDASVNGDCVKVFNVSGRYYA